MALATIAPGVVVQFKAIDMYRRRRIRAALATEMT